MLDQVYSTNVKSLFCSVIILFVLRGSMNHSPRLFLVRSRCMCSIERLSRQGLLVVEKHTLSLYNNLLQYSYL